MESACITSENTLSSPLLKSIDPILYQGIHVEKIHSDGSVASSTLTLSSCNFYFSVRADTNTLSGFLKDQYKRFASLDLARFIDIADVTHIFTGFVGTTRLEKWKYTTLYDEDRDADGMRTVTIIHSDFQTLDLIAATVTDATKIYHALKTIQKVYNILQHHIKKEDLLIRYLWRDVDRNSDSYIEWKEMETALQRLNIYTPNAKKMFLNAIEQGRNKEKKLTYGEFLSLLQSFQNSAIANMIWDRVFGTVFDTVSKRDFLERFLYPLQKENETNMETVDKIFSSMSIPGDTINRSQFHMYLHSVGNNLSTYLTINRMDMSQPLSAYWINTSHNTYAVGNQLTSESSVQMYLYALCRGCRSLEIDCWDGDKRGSSKNNHSQPIPVVYHGHTLMSQITFADVIRCIRGWILENPETYPVILSLENHCSPPFQLEMARILRDVLGDLLYVPELHDFSSDSLPSPYALCGKVIVKGKRHAQNELEDDDEENEEDLEEKPVAQDDVKHIKVQIIPELAKLTLFEGAKFKSFGESSNLHPTMMHSLSEHKIGKLLKQSETNGVLLRKQNVSHITRIYPMGIRFDSSNLNPLTSWATGCQMIALNVQGQDNALILNDGRFRENGGSGYVRKPYRLLRDNEDDSFQTEGCKPVTIRIKVLSGLCLPKPSGLKKGEIIDSYVSLSMYDVCDDMERTTHHATQMIRDNGFSPVWNEKRFTDFKVFNPDVAMLMFKVMDQDVGRDDEVCFNAIPVSSLRPGIRVVELFDKHNNHWGPFKFAALLVESEIIEE